VNDKVGSDNIGKEDAMRRHGCGMINDNGERLVGFSLENSCMIRGTVLPYRGIHKLSWGSTNGHTVNQYDDVIVNKKRQRSLQDVKVHRGVDVRSDHHLVIAEDRLKIQAKTTTKRRRKVFDISTSRAPEAKRLRNPFNALENDDKDGEDQDTVETAWDNITKGTKKQQ